MEKIFDVKFEIYSNFKINKTNTKIIKRAVNDLNERLKFIWEVWQIYFVS